MTSIPRCSYAMATASTSGLKRMMHIGKALCLVPSRGAAPSSPVLDFLLPRSASNLAILSTSSRRGYDTATTTTGTNSPAMLPRAEAHPRIRQHRSLSNGRRRSSSPLFSSLLTPRSSSSSASWGQAAQQLSRYFSTTTKPEQTQTVLNPQTDDDGNEMRLEITSRAATRLSKVMENEGNPRLALRIQVESGGCHGFQYVMSLVTLPDQLPTVPKSSNAGADVESAVIREDDTIFSYAAGQEEGLSGAGPSDPLSAPKIILDTPSLELLNGSKVDFTKELIGSQFTIVDNPAASSSCGCGTSFDIKV